MDALAWLNAHPQPFYAAAMLVALAFAVGSGRHVWIKVGLLLLLDWVGCNLIEAVNGYARAPLLLPTMEAAIGTMVGILALANRDRVAAAVFGIFVATCGLWAVAFWLHGQDSFLCYLLANLLFLARVVVVGGASGRAYLATRPLRGSLRLRHHPSSR